MDMELSPIGTVESSLTDRATAPKQGDEGAPEAELCSAPRWPRASTASSRATR